MRTLKALFSLVGTWLRWDVLNFYYYGLLVQAGYLYRQSDLFKLRWQYLGLEFAENEFYKNPGEAMLFLRRVQKGPFLIKAKIFLDGITGQERRSYYLPD